MIDIKSLEAACAQIEETSRGEITVDLNGTPVHLRMLLPEDELAILREALAAITGDEESYGAQKYKDALKKAVLCRVIVQIGTVDLRSETYIATGEVLENGAVAKVFKEKALRDLISKWGTLVRETLFVAFASLQAREEIAAEHNMVFEPSDIDTEIERLTARITELQETKDKIANRSKSAFSEQVQTVAQGEVSDQEEAAPDAVEEVPVQAPPPPAPVAPVPVAPPAPVPAPAPAQAPAHAVAAADYLAARRRPAPMDEDANVDPTAFGQVPRMDRRPEPAGPRQVAEQPVRTPPPRRTEIPEWDNIQDSFADSSEEGVMAAEAARIIAARRRNGLMGQESQPTQPEGNPGRRVPPHLAAQQAEEALKRMPLELNRPDAGSERNPRFRKG